MTVQTAAAECLEAIRAERRALEFQIREALQPLLARFEATTGLSPCGLRVEFVEVTTLADATPRHLVGEVAVELPRI